MVYSISQSICFAIKLIYKLRSNVGYLSMRFFFCKLLLLSISFYILVPKSSYPIYISSPFLYVRFYCIFFSFIKALRIRAFRKTFTYAHTAQTFLNIIIKPRLLNINQSGTTYTYFINLISSKIVLYIL